jgi:hydrogenase maturation protein HypF
VERIAHLRPFQLPGADQAVKEPRRAALGLLYEMFGETILEKKEIAAVATLSKTELVALKTMLEMKLNSPTTTSMGRLFDAVASLVNLRQQIHFEGQAAMELEFALNGIETDEHYDSPLVTRGPSLVMDWSPMIKAILGDIKAAVPVGTISARFHNTLVEAIITVAKRVGESCIVLSGGCFQNRYLTWRAVKRLREEKFRPYWHQRVPPNDGGIALGQVMAALRNKS